MHAPTEVRISIRVEIAGCVGDRETLSGIVIIEHCEADAFNTVQQQIFAAASHADRSHGGLGKLSIKRFVSEGIGSDKISLRGIRKRAVVIQAERAMRRAG